MTFNQHTQTLTYWGPNGHDGFGDAFHIPVEICGRWEARQESFRTITGEELISNAVVFVESDVEADGYIIQGDQTEVTDPLSLEGAYQIRKVISTPDLLANSYERKVML